MIDFENLAISNGELMTELENAARRVIRSGKYILGDEVSNFENEFSNFFGVKHCIGVGSGLDAITLSLKALALPTSSDILVSSNTYIATILAIMHAGHHPILVEPNIDTFNMDIDCLKKAITPKSRAVCVTHMFGKPCRMDLICAFAKESGLEIIEDCAQAHGAMLGNQFVGTFGVAGCFSFYPTKNLGGVGDGGAVLTNDDVLADKLRHYRNYGSKAKYQNKYLGFNSRLDEIQAAFLRVKLSHLASFNKHKRFLAGIYSNHLPGWLTKPKLTPDEYDVFHIYAVRHKFRDKIKVILDKQGIKTEIHYPTPPHLQECMRGVLDGYYPISEKLHATQLSLPISIGTTEKEVKIICDAFNAIHL